MKNYYMYRMYNLFALSKSDEELRLEKEKLMHLQNTAAERKMVNNFGKSEEKENNNEENNEKDLNLPLNENENIEILKVKENQKENNEGSEEDNSDIDLI